MSYVESVIKCHLRGEEAYLRRGCLKKMDLRKVFKHEVVVMRQRILGKARY